MLFLFKDGKFVGLVKTGCTPKEIAVQQGTFSTRVKTFENKQQSVLAESFNNKELYESCAGLL